MAFAGDVLEVVYKQNACLQILVTQRLDTAILYGVVQFAAEAVRCQIGGLPSGFAFSEAVADGVQQMGFAQAVCRPNEQRIICLGWVVGDSQSGFVCESV